MGKELTVLAVAAVFIFGWWYFTKQGCNGKLNGMTGTNDATGEVGSLCYTGEDILGQSSDGGDEDVPPPEEAAPAPASTPSSSGWPARRGTVNCNSATGKCTCPNGAHKQLNPGVTAAQATTACGGTATPKQLSAINKAFGSKRALAFYVNNQITIA